MEGRIYVLYQCLFIKSLHFQELSMQPLQWRHSTIYIQRTYPLEYHLLRYRGNRRRRSGGWRCGHNSWSILHRVRRRRWRVCRMGTFTAQNRRLSSSDRIGAGGTGTSGGTGTTGGTTSVGLRHCHGRIGRVCDHSCSLWPRQWRDRWDWNYRKYFSKKDQRVDLDFLTLLEVSPLLDKGDRLFWVAPQSWRSLWRCGRILLWRGRVGCHQWDQLICSHRFCRSLWRGIITEYILYPTTKCLFCLVDSDPWNLANSRWQ